MTKFAIVGASRGATLHADAILRTPGADLVGVGGRPGSAELLAEVAEVPDLSMAELVAHADVMVVAVPPAELAGVTQQLASLRGELKAALIEMPIIHEISALPFATMTASNFLYAPLARRALSAITHLDAPHHVQIRITQPEPTWGAHGQPGFGGPALDPGGRLVTLLAVAAGEPIINATVTNRGTNPTTETVTFGLASGREASIKSTWQPGAARTELEVADRSGVVSLAFDPLPTLAIDGHEVENVDDDPLVAMGFVPQIERIMQVANGRAKPWPDIDVGEALGQMMYAAVNERPRFTEPTDS